MNKPIRFFATIDPRSPRVGWWLDVFTSDCVEVESGTSEMGVLHDGRECPVYRVRLRAFPSHEVERIAGVLARRWREPTYMVLLEINGEEGLQVEAEGLHIGTDRESGRAHFAALMAEGGGR